MLINELKAEHVLLGQKLNEIKDLGVSSDEGRKMLLSLKEPLLNHLGKEDKNLYPVLQEEAKNNDVLRSMLGTFDNNMKNIAQNALNIFKKCEEPIKDPVAFGKDFGLLTWSLGIRIRQEESILYKEFENILNKK